MQTTGHGEVDRLLRRLTGDIESTLGDQLAGLYVYGSLVTGDFDPRLSDVDLLAVTRTDVDQQTVDALGEMHAQIIIDFPAWDDRVEVAYLSEAALRTFRTERSPIVVISPGEPLNVKDAGADWLMNWYIVRERGVALAGPPPAELIGPISREEFVESVVQYARWCARQIEDKRTKGAQAYAILTMCRALYTVRTGEQTSKLRAADWAQAQMPEWREVIADAVAWREVQWETPVDGADTHAKTSEFVRHVSDLLAR